MAENQNNGQDDQGQEPFDEGRVEENSNGDTDIIELSDIAIGIGPEDEEIIELTEEVIVESMNGITGATSEDIAGEEDVLDLSEAKPAEEIPLTEKVVETPVSGPEDLAGTSEGVVADIEEQISEELDNYFGTDEDITFDETILDDAVSAKQEPEGLFESPGTRLEEAVERVLKKMFSDKIDKMYAEVLKISDDIRNLKERLNAGER